MGLWIEGKPVTRVAEGGKLLNLIECPIGQQRRGGLLRATDPNVALRGRQPTGQHFGHPLIKLAQQGRLPAVPHLRRHRAHVGDSQHQQQAQALRRLNDIGEVQDDLRVVDVALERDVGKQQVVQDQPGDRFGLLRRQAKRRADGQRQLGADLRMIAAAALGDVVQEHRKIQRAARLHLVDQAASDRSDRDQLAIFDLVSTPTASTVCSSTV